jgi:protein O-mannosyl-transferase
MSKKQPKPTAKIIAKPTPAPRVKEGPAAKSPAWWPMALVAMLVTAMCFWPNISDELVNWDDDPNILENVNLRMAGKGESWGTTISNIFDLERGNVIGNYNPLPILTFAIEKSWSGGEFGPKLYRMIHVNNVLLHLGVVFFSMWVLMLLGIGRWGALLGGLLMGIHPMRVESVLWATERKDVLFAIFFFASLGCYIKYVKAGRGGIGWFVGAMLLGILSLFSKVQAVTLVGSWVLVDYYLRRPFSLNAVLDKVLLTVASVGIGIANLKTLAAQGSTDDSATGYGMLDRMAIGSWSFCTYLYKLLIPYPLSPLYPYPKPIPGWMYVTPILFLGGLGLLGWMWWKQRRVGVFALGFFICNVILLLQFFGAGQGYLADRFTYVPYFGFFFGAGWLLERYFNVEKTHIGVLIGLAIPVVIYAIMTYRQGKIWQNGDALWTHALQYQYNPLTKRYENHTPFWNRGQYRRRLAESKNDLKLYEIALADYIQAANTNPKEGSLNVSLGKTYFDMGLRLMGNNRPKQTEYFMKAVDQYNMAIQKQTGKAKPKDLSESYTNRGSAHGALNNYPAALADLNKALEIFPNNKNAYFNRSIVYFNSQNYPAALQDYTSYLKYEPNDASILYERGMLYRSMNRPQEALADLNKAIQINPKGKEAYLERARALQMLGQNDAAQADYQKARQMGINVPLMNEK